MNPSSTSSTWPDLPESIRRRFVSATSHASSRERVIYRALDIETQRQTAIKTYVTANLTKHRRLENEFQRLQKLQHRNIVRVLDLFHDEQGYARAFSMEWIDGLTPTPWVWQDGTSPQGTPFSDLQTLDFEESTSSYSIPIHHESERVVHRQTAENELDIHVLSARGRERFELLVAQLFDTLCYLREQQVVHGDIKHGNLRMEAGGRLVLFDFGAQPWSKDTLEGLQFTPEYAAPEVIHGRRPTFASDVYSAAIVLYETATRRRFCQASRKSHHFRLRELRRSGVDVRLARALASSLNDNPSERPIAPELQRWFARRRLRLSTAASPSAEALGERQAIAQRILHHFQSSDRGIAMVQGDSGSGKTSVAMWVATEWLRKPNAYVVWVQSPPYSSTPYQGLRSYVLALQDVHHAVGSPDALARWNRAIEDPLLHSFLRRIPDEDWDTSDNPLLEDTHVLARSLGIIQQLFTALVKDCQLLIVFDNGHCLDDDSLQSFFRLTQAYQENELFILITTQTGFEKIPYFEALVEASDMPPMLMETLGPLDEQDQLYLVSEVVGDARAPAILKTLRPAFSNNPSMLVWMSRWIVEEGRLDDEFLSISELIEAKLRSLPPLERRIVDILALVQTPLPAHLLSCFLNDHLLGTMSELEALGFVQRATPQTPDDFLLRNDALRDVILEHIEATRMRELLFMLAHAAEKEMSANPAFIADIYQRLGEHETASVWLSRAIDQAMSRAAFAQATKLIHRSFSLSHPSDHASLRLRLADALEGLGEYTEAAEELIAACHSLEAVRSIELRRRAAELLLSMGHHERGHTLLTDVLQELGCTIYQGIRQVPGTWIRNHRTFQRYATKKSIAQLTQKPEANNHWHVRRIEALITAGNMFIEHNMLEGWFYHAQAAKLSLQGVPIELLRSIIGSEVAYVSLAGPASRSYWVTVQAFFDDLHSERFGLTPAELFRYHVISGSASLSMGRIPDAIDGFKTAIHHFEHSHLRSGPIILSAYYLLMVVHVRELELQSAQELIQRVASNYSLVSLPAFLPIIDMWGRAQIALAQGHPEECKAILDAYQSIATPDSQTQFETFIWHHVHCEWALYTGNSVEVLRRFERSLVGLSTTSVALAHFTGVTLVFSFARLLLDARHHKTTPLERVRWRAMYTGIVRTFDAMNSVYAQQALCVLRLTEYLQQGKETKARAQMTLLERWCRDGSGQQLLLAAKQAFYEHHLGPPLHASDQLKLTTEGVAHPRRALRAYLPSRR